MKRKRYEMRKNEKSKLNAHKWREKLIKTVSKFTGEISDANDLMVGTWWDSDDIFVFDAKFTPDNVVVDNGTDTTKLTADATAAWSNAYLNYY